MQVILWAYGRQINITEYVDKPIPQNKMVGDLYGSASLIIPHIMRYEVGNEIDLSQEIPKMSIIEVTDIEDTRQYYVIKSEVDNLGNEEYKHTVELKSLELLLSYRPISDFSVTQPVEDNSVYFNELSRSDEEFFNPYMVDYEKIDFNTEIISQDINYIENRYIKDNGKYKIAFNLNIDDTVFKNVYGAKIHKIYFEIRIGGDRIGGLYQDITINNVNKKRTFTIDYTNEGNNEVEVYMYCQGDMDISLSGKFDATLEIIYKEVRYGEVVYLDTVVDKLLNLTSVNIKEFYLDEITASRLALIKAFDDMQTETTLYDALNRIANYVKAKVRLSVDFDNKRKIVWFEFYDDLSQADFVEVDNDQENIISDVNEYTSAFELKNNNILKTNFLTETITLRASGYSQVTTENIFIQLTYPIDRIRKIEIIGKEFYDIDNALIVSDTTAVDITENVVLYDYYRTLDNQANYSNRSQDNKNNHLWFERGGTVIEGLTYSGITKVNWLGDTETNRALYETMATVISRQQDKIIAPLEMTGNRRIDGGKVDDDVLIIKVDYVPFSESSAVIQRDDQSGHEERIIRKLNANERVNNADMLGAYARQKVNAIGGTQKAIRGITNNADDIPKLASSNGDYRVVSVTKYSNDEDIEFIATLVKDYIFESEYVGIDSDRRLYRIPKDDYVDRVDKSLNMLYFDKEEVVGNETSFNLEGLVSILTSSAGSFVPPKIAYLSFDGNHISQYVDVNALGNTVEFRTAMLDNYSAGFRKLNTSLNGQPFTYQRGVPYTDVFGRVDNLSIEYYAYLDNQTVANLNEYPEGQTMGLGLIGEFAYQVRKDARERIILSTQISFLSNHEDIIIYDGLAKYNRQVLNETRDIKMAVLDYEPNRYDKFIDISEAEVIDNNATLNSFDSYIQFYSSVAGHIAWFDNESKELLLVVRNVSAGYTKIYYKGKKYEIGEPSYLPIKINRLGATIKHQSSVEMHYVTNIEVSDEHGIGVDIKKAL